ncbi:nucleic acid/nucleotide deaminase domain-containing protein [Streptomyces sp. H27-D2]|nr:nucleic acid/nucleotide deaminase domain-containing protein [Streptomyces sp. H27-D2]MEC4018295.1 nucleic acid/nucleotide deaminase domain-containing protein [Streptomyces sp. H27-D2]
MADSLDTCAGFIEGCKAACITELGTTAAAATVGVVGMVFSFGASAAISAGAIVLCRFALHEALDYAIAEITSVVTDKIEAEILGKIEDVFTDRLGAGEEDLADYATGSADMAQGLVIEFDEFDRAAGDYRKTRDNFDKKKGAHKTGGAKRRSSVKKDSRFHKLGTIMDKAEDAVDKKADQTVDVLEEHGGKIDKSKKEHKDEDERRKRDFDECKSDGDDDVPMYLLSKDGTVRDLTPDGELKRVDKNDDSGIHGLLESNGKVWRPTTRGEGARYRISAEDTKNKVESKKVNAYDNELGRATQLARYAGNDYSSDNNYAAGRYIDPTTKREIILVGASDRGMHSERVIGYPLLHKGKAAGLDEVFTERAPCQLRNSRCDAWLAKYFVPENPGLKVRNTVDYDQLGGKKDEGNAQHAKYMAQLKKSHGR